MRARRINSVVPIFSYLLVLVFSGLSVPSAKAGWYVPGAGGFNPNLPDFYQHQDYISGLNFAGGANGANGWEPLGGWCEYTAYSDALYDLTTRGYKGLFAVDPTANPWQTSLYGPNTTAAGVQASDIYKLVGAMGTVGNNWQAFLNLTTNQNLGGLPPLLSNSFPTGANGNVYYYNAFGQLTNSGQSVYTFTNTVVRNTNAEVLYRLRSGTANLAPNANGQSVWWGGNGGGSFHYVALAGISVANGNVSIADPDTNMGSGPTAAGWPHGQNALNIGFPFSSPAGSPLPVQANAAPLTQDFADFTFTGRSVTSVAAPQYNGTYVQSVNTISPLVVRRANARGVVRPGPAGGIAPAGGQMDEETDITIDIPSDSNPVDQVFVEPSSQTVDPTVAPSEFSLVDDTNSSDTWSDTEMTTDPFGNTIADDGIDYDLTSGNPLEPGDMADLDIGTAADFSGTGYDVFLHYAGDPSDEWVPEEIGGTNFDPEDTASVQTVPEPASIGLLLLGCAVAAGRCRQR
jgi:hypothetical protein